MRVLPNLGAKIANVTLLRFCYIDSSIISQRGGKRGEGEGEGIKSHVHGERGWGERKGGGKGGGLQERERGGKKVEGEGIKKLCACMEGGGVKERDIKSYVYGGVKERHLLISGA